MKNAVKMKFVLAAALILLLLAAPCALADRSAPEGEFRCGECAQDVTLGSFVSSNDKQCGWVGDCGHTVWVDHDYIAAEEKPATCTQDGLAGKICRWCGYQPTLDALGHSYVCEPVDGTYHKKRCTRSGCTESVIERHTPAVDASGNPIWLFDATVERHYERCDKCAMTLNDQKCDFVVSSTLNATCTQEGQQMLRCTICGGHKTEILPAGHLWSAWTQNGSVSERVCQREGCGAKEICDHAKNINPLCAAAPVCSVCGASLEKQPHDWQAVSYVWSGDECTATRVCRLCRTEEMQTARASGESVKPTCTERGYTKYTPVFESWAKDTTGASIKTVYTAGALGHEWCPWKDGKRNCLRAGCKAEQVCSHTGLLTVYAADWPQALPAGGLKTVTAMARCRQCGALVSQSGLSVRRASSGDVPASCEKDASERYEALDASGSVISTHDYALAGTALGHDWRYSYAWDTAEGLCTGRAMCSRDASHVYETTVACTVSAHPSCTEKTIATLTAVFPEIAECGLWQGGHTETAERVLNAVGHDDEETVVPPTCEEDGYTIFTCRRCGRVETGRETQALGHDFVDWTPVEGENVHTAVCSRADCQATARAACALRALTDEENALLYCPICGYVSGGTRFELIEDARVDAFAGQIALPGQLVLRRGMLPDGREAVLLCFESAGEIVRPECRVTVSLPADGEIELRDWALLGENGIESALSLSVNEEGRVVIELDYTLLEDGADAALADALLIILRPRVTEEIVGKA